MRETFSRHRKSKVEKRLEGLLWLMHMKRGGGITKD